jgi:hypothetical protein
MDLLFFLLLVTLVGIVILVISIKRILREGVKDEVDYPLANCDTSMLEEIMPEEKKNE